MIYNKIIKLKKYLFLISILFFVLTSTHLVYIYLYNDSEIIPIKGGIISEGLIGSFPSLNPLKPLNGNNKYIVNLLYRSLLQYDSEKNIIVSDLANCDINNLKEIECYLKDNVFWSNGDTIKIEDIIETYKLLKNTGVNKITSSLLENTTIKQNNNTIVFQNAKKDINFLNIFFQPILSTQTINSIGNDTIFGDFPTHEQIYSGDFVLSNISSDGTIGITKILLNRNPFNNNGNISQLIIKLFPNSNSLLKNKETINVFNDSNNLIGKSIHRLETNKYTLPQFVSLFINSENIDNKNIRNHILNKINTKNLIQLIGEENFEEVKNPYLTKTTLNNELSNKNFENIISNLGYIKKSKIISNYLPKVKTFSDEASITIEKKEENIENINLTIDEFQTNSKYIVQPSYVDKYNFISKDDILLQGNAGKNISAIYINDYKLTNFKANSSKFYYRLKLDYNSLKDGINSYKIIFEENGKKELKEEIFFVYAKNDIELQKHKTTFIKQLHSEKQQKETDKKSTTNTDKIEIDNKKFQQISNLDAKFYYNKDLEKYTINLFYISNEKELEDTAFFIKNSLLEIGINVELFPISLGNLGKLLSNKSEYDMLLTGINLGYFDYNIFPYFHSSQAKSGYNFSNIKKTSLDILLEDLKSDTFNNEGITSTKEKVIKILQKEQIIKTLYTPKINLLIDKNIKKISIPSKLITKDERKNIYNTLYVREEKNINFTNKGFFDFIKFLATKING